MRFNNCATDIQAHPKAFGLGTVKRFKEALGVFQAMTAIDDGHFQKRFLLGNHQLKHMMLAVFHGFDPIFEQIQ